MNWRGDEVGGVGVCVCGGGGGALKNSNLEEDEYEDAEDDYGE